MRVSVVRVVFFLAILLLTKKADVRPQAGPHSGLTGVVVDSTNAPIQFAVVTVGEGNVGTTADEDGKFRITGIDAGIWQFRVRRVGYEPVFFEVDLPEKATVQVRVMLHQTPNVLAGVVVSDIREPLKRVGFYERMMAGNGHFITPEYLDKIRPQRSSDVLMNIPDLVVDRRGSRSRIMTGNYRCEYALYIDGIMAGEPGSRVRTTSPDDLVSASDLYAVEVYPRNRGLPPKYLGMSHEDGCGTVLIWTKGMIAR